MLKKLKSFYKNNRVYSILMVISIICILAIIIGVICYFLGQTSKNVYGNRLEGIEKVKLTDKNKKSIEDGIKSNDIVESVEVDLRGKLIYITFTIKEGTHKDVETISQTSYDSIDEKIKKFYDIQYIVDSKADTEENFPIMGYIKSGNKVISWTNYTN